MIDQLRIETFQSHLYKDAGVLPHSKEVLNKWYDEGNTIIFQTARGMGRSGNSSAFAYTAFERLTKDQLNNWGVKFHKLYMTKPSFDFYVDDKSYAFNKDWPNYVKKKFLK